MGREGHGGATSPELAAAIAGRPLGFSDGGMSIDLSGGDHDSASRMEHKTGDN